MKLKLQPLVFSASDLRSIAQAAALCNDGTGKLIRLIQQIRQFGEADVEFLTPVEIDYFSRLAARLEADVTLALYLQLLGTGLVFDGYLDLEAFANRCQTKIAH